MMKLLIHLLFVMSLAQTEQAFAQSYIPDSENISRASSRLMVGNAALLTDENNPAATWCPDAPACAHWLAKNSVFCAMPDSTNRLIGVTGFSNTKLGESVAIGVAGGIITNRPGKTGWAFYADVQHESGLQAFGLEVAAKNKSAANPTATPYALSTGVVGIWLAGGGDDKYGGPPAHPNNAAIVVLKNSSTWNKGLVFSQDGLTGSDGMTGKAVAIEMAEGHLIQWMDETYNVANIGIEGDGGTLDVVVKPAGTKGKLVTPKLNISNIPTSSEGLSPGDIYSRDGVLMVMP